MIKIDLRKEEKELENKLLKNVKVIVQTVNVKRMMNQKLKF